jgi:anti-sigma factor ChrR (cupin superfamily)
MSADDEVDPTVFDALALGLPGEAAPGGLRAKLLALAGGRERFLPFLDRMMSLFDLPETDARDQLYSVDRPDDWDDMLPGVQYRDFEGGPAVGEAHGGLVRLAPGQEFPAHTHVGEERVLILQGTLADDQGNVARPGDLVISDDATTHALRNVGDNEVIYAALVVAIAFVGDDDDDDD